MMVSLSPETLARLHAIEAEEGVPISELVDQATTAWSFLKGEENVHPEIGGPAVEDEGDGLAEENEKERMRDRRTDHADEEDLEDPEALRPEIAVKGCGIAR